MWSFKAARSPIVCRQYVELRLDCDEPHEFAIVAEITEGRGKDAEVIDFEGVRVKSEAQANRKAAGCRSIS
jgi:hypothetical protein